MSLTAFVLIALQEAQEICEGQINVSILSATQAVGRGVLASSLTAVIKRSDQKQPEGEKGFFQVIAPVHSHPQGKSRQGLKGRHACCSVTSDQ